MKYNVYVTWGMSGYTVIEADSLEEAQEKALDLSLSEFEAEYLSDSFSLDCVEILCERCEGQGRIPDNEELFTNEDGMMPCPSCEGRGALYPME